MWYLKCSIAAGMWISIFTPVRVEKGFGAIHCQYVPVSHCFFFVNLCSHKMEKPQNIAKYLTGPSWHMQESNAACRSPSLIGKLDFSKTLTTNLFQCAIKNRTKIAPKRQHYTHSASKFLICKTSRDCVWNVIQRQIDLCCMQILVCIWFLIMGMCASARADGQSYVLFHAFVLFERDLHILWVHHPLFVRIRF